MKKAFLGILCAAVLTMHSAFAELVTLSELKQQLPERLQMTVTTKEGKTIEVNAPIILPDGDTMPVVLVQSATFDLTDLYRVFPHPDYFEKNVRMVAETRAYKGSPMMQLFAEEKPNRLTGKADTTVRTRLSQGEKPPENDVSVDEIMAFIYENIERFGCDTEPDIRVIKATANSGLYSMKKYKTSEGWTEYTINEKKPVKNAGKGMWHLDLAQFMYGVRIFDRYYPYASYQGPDNPNHWQPPVSIHCDYMDEKYFNILMMLAKETDILLQDAQLLSYDALVRVLQERMKEGKLRNIYGLTLGYSIKIVKGDACWTDDTYRDYNVDARFVLVPEWEILGFDEQDAATAKSLGLVEPTKEMILEPEIYSRYGLSYDVRMDASTGAFILDFEALEYDLNKHGGEFH